MLQKLVLKVCSCRWTLHPQQGACPQMSLGPQPKNSVTKQEEKKTSSVRICLNKDSDCSGWDHMPIPEPVIVATGME